MPAEPFLVIGRPARNHKQVGFLDTENLYSYAAATIELSSISAIVPPVTAGRSWLTQDQLLKFLKPVVEKFSALQSFVESGHTLTIVIDAMPSITYATKEGPHKSWGLNQIDVIQRLALTANKGSTALVASNFEPLAAWEDRFSYLFSFEADIDPVFHATAAIRGNEKIIAGCRKFGKGKIYFVPPLSQSTLEARGDFYTEISTFKTEVSAEKTPDWVKQYSTPKEKIAISNVKSKQDQIAQLQAEILQIDKALLEFESDKRLLFSKDETFLEAARLALEELGFTAVKGPPGRADIIAFQDGKLLAIEAKGLEGAAKERDFRQALQWKAEVEATVTADDETISSSVDYKKYADALAMLGIPLRQDELSVECRPVVIIGTYRTQPLSERTERDFPDAVEKVIKRSHGTGIGGLTLFDLVHQVRENPTLKASFREKFYQDGIILGRPWSDLFTHSTDTAT